MAQIQLIASYIGGVARPIVVGYIVYLAFLVVENHTTSRLKQDLARFLTSRSYELYLGALPLTLANICNRVFGANYVTLRSIKKSVWIFIFSSAGLLLFSASFGWNDVKLVAKILYTFDIKSHHLGRWLIICWLIVAVFTMFLNVLKSRIIIDVLEVKRPRVKSLLLIFILDFVFSIFLFVALLVFSGVLTIVFITPTSDVNQISESATSTVWATFIISSIIYPFAMLIILQNIGVYRVLFGIPLGDLFWSSFMPVAILWMYIISCLLTRFVAQFIPLFRYLVDYALDVEKEPFKTVGFLAAIVSGLLCAIWMISVSIWL